MPRVGAREATGSAADEPMQQDDGVEMKRVMRHVVYVAERDGDYAAWWESWNSQGYNLMRLNINEPDPQDGRVGQAFELQGPLTPA